MWKLPIAPMGDSQFAPCLQGGGINVHGGKVSIVNSQVYSNQADIVRAHLQNSHHPLGVKRFSLMGKRFSCQPCTKVTTVTSRTLLPDQGPNVYVNSGATVCSWATTLIGVVGTVSTCQAPLPPSLPPSPPPSPPPPPPDLALIPATISSNIPTAITFVGTALADGATCAFLPAGDDTCAGAAASGLFPTGGVLSRGLVTVRLSGPMIYKLCAAPAGSDPSLDAHFMKVSSLLLTSLSPSPLPSPPSPSTSPDKAMDIGPIAGGVGGGLLLLAGLCGLAWKLRRMRATPKSSGLELPQELQGSVSPVRLLESD